MEEIWKDIEGYEGLYQVSNLGRVKSLRREIVRKNERVFTVKEKIIKPNINSGIGYLFINLYKDKKGFPHTIHRLLAVAFIPNPENKPCVNHIDGDKLNNSLDNLEWSTYSENNKHAFTIGLKSNVGLFTGERNGISKLSEKDVIQIKYELVGLTNRRIAEMFNVDESCISLIKRNKNWRHI